VLKGHNCEQLTYNTQMQTYLLSDLHLTPERPTVTQAFLTFLAGPARNAERVYILGDLFEFWIGDDAASMLGADLILDAMAELSAEVECFFIAGNRDFLVRDAFSQRTGFTILNDETVVDLYGTATLLLHGDSLCIDDIAHQKFRQEMVTNALFCDAFLSLSIPQRIEQAKQARIQSKQHKSEVSMGIMDVTESAVMAAFSKHHVGQMIHGHTHRQDTHRYNPDLVRYVLGDWHSSSSIMKATKNGLEIENKKIEGLPAN
jgi:UDP-2,3-diacylglucosamine hydrolase